MDFVMPQTPVLGSVFLAIAVVLFSWYTHRLLRKADIRRLPTSLPWFGDSLHAASRFPDYHDWIHEWYTYFQGQAFMLQYIGQPTMVVLTTTDAVHDVLVTQAPKFGKGRHQAEQLSGLYGGGLFTSDGAVWWHQRKLTSRFFTANTLRAIMQQSMQKNLLRMADILDTALASGEPPEMKRLFHDYTLDTFAEIALGVDLCSLGASSPHPFQHGLDTASAVVPLRFIRPAWYWKLERWLGVGSEGELARGMQQVYAWIHEIVGISLNKQHDKTPRATKSIVDLYCEFTDPDQFNTQELVDLVLTFVIAARDTTGDTLCWFFYLLSHHPHVEHKLIHELGGVVHHLGSVPSFIDSDNLQSTVYLDACIRETLRLYPGAPFTIREVFEDTVIGGNIPLTKGQLVGLPIYSLARNHEIWGDDATEFKPERWIDGTSGRLRHVPPSTFLSFGDGPRVCLGKSLALLELRMTTANLLLRYHFDKDPHNDGAYKIAPDSAMKSPLRMPVHRREWTPHGIQNKVN